jgi:DNA-binding MarR family transcriptional regulator
MIDSKSQEKLNVPLLFGSRTRMNFLLYIIGSPAASIAQIARDLRVDKGHVLAMTRHFEKTGAITVDRTSARGHSVSLNRDFAVYHELHGLLLRLAQPGIVRKRTKPMTTHEPLAECSHLEQLLGTRARTLTIAMLSRLGSMTLIELAKSVGCSHGSIRVVIAHLVGQRIVRCVQIGSFVHVSLDDRSAGATELRALGRVLGDLLSLDAAPEPLPESRRRRIDAANSRFFESPELLFPFGTLTQSKLLLALGRVGRIRTADLADLVALNQDQVRGIAESLIRARMVVRASERGGRNLERWYSLNSLHPLHMAIVDYSSHMFSDKRERRSERRALKRAQNDLILPEQASFTLVEGCDRRADVLFAVYEEGGQHAAQIAQRIDLAIPRTEAHLEQLFALGLITYAASEGMYRAAMNPRFRYAIPLRALVAAASSMRKHK